MILQITLINAAKSKNSETLSLSTKSTNRQLAPTVGAIRDEVRRNITLLFEMKANHRHITRENGYDRSAIKISAIKQINSSGTYSIRETNKMGNVKFKHTIRLTKELLIIIVTLPSFW